MTKDSPTHPHHGGPGGHRRVQVVAHAHGQGIEPEATPIQIIEQSPRLQEHGALRGEALKLVDDKDGSLLSAKFLISDERGALHGFAGLAWINIGCGLLACAGVWFLIRGLERARDNNNPASGTARQGSQ